MEPRIYHGDLSPEEVSRALIAHFNSGNIVAQQVGSGNQIVVQISTRQQPSSGGQTSLTISIQKVEDGLAVQFGKQNWLGVAASIGMTAMSAWRNPLNLIGRLDDIAQDIENLKLSQEALEIIENVAYLRGASFELSERLRRLVCPYCQTANPIGAPSCIACGAPLGTVQPRTCRNCGFVVKTQENTCPNCGKGL